MNDSDLATTLNNIERKILPLIKENHEFLDLVDESGLKDIEVMRALQWLQNKNLVELKEQITEFVSLDVNGKEYSKKGLPEIRFLKSLTDKFQDLNSILKISGLQKEEVNICIGTLKKKAAIDLKKDKGLTFKITDQGKKLLEKPSLEQQFLEKIRNSPIDFAHLAPEEKFAFDNLIKRKGIIKKEQIKKKYANLTELGKLVSKQDLSADYIERLTPKMIKSKEWKDKKFRKYDVKVNVPKINYGKRHFVNEAINYIKKIWLELGFKEMQGNMLQTSLWDLDALFVPQDHPAREMQDTFYIKDPRTGKIDKSWLKKIKAVHEHGADTGSKGWQAPFSEEKAKENLLRTHTTVLSAQTIAKLKEKDLPQKFFTVGKVFRNETLDWKHLFEFYQVEGIVVDPDANFSNLIGYLKNFFGKMGFKDARIRPAHFPYTEPSAEIDVLHPVTGKWIELGGCGIFRPEVTKTLIGKEIPVLAWGFGMGRIISAYFGITDIRDLYKNDLKQLREMKSWLKS